MATPESKVKDAIKAWLKAHGFVAVGYNFDFQEVLGWYYMPQNMGMGVNGLPDFIGSYRDKDWIARPFGIEAKAPDKSATALQKDRHAEMRCAGWFVLVCDDVSQLAPLEERLGRI